MTCNTSAVAVCCSNASRVSVMSRAFSIAITACAAKFSSSATSFSENGRTSWRYIAMHPRSDLSLRSAPQISERAPQRRAERIRTDIRDLTCGLAANQPPHCASRQISNWLAVILKERRREATRRHARETLAVIGKEGAKGRAAQAKCLFQHRLEHRG